MGTSVSWKPDSRFGVSDALWERVEPLLPVVERRFRYPGRRRYPDRDCLDGIVEVARLGVPWSALARCEGRPSGLTCWRRLDEWTRAGVWERVLGVLIAEIDAAGVLDTSRLMVDATTVPAKKGAPRRGRARSTGENRPAKST